MKNFLYLFFGVLFFPAAITGQDTNSTLLSEAEVLDSTVFKKALGQNVIILTDELKNENDGLQQLAFISPLNISTNGPGLITNPYLRGTHADGTQLFWNGLPVNSPTLGTSDLSYWYPSQVEEILLLPGGSGAELGSGAIGGSIFLNNKMEFSKEHQHSIKLNSHAGSYGRFGSLIKYQYSGKNNSFTINPFFDKATNNFDTQTPDGRKFKMPNAAYNRKGMNISYQHRFKKALFQTYAMGQLLYRKIPDNRAAYNSSGIPEAYEQDNSIRWQNRFCMDDWVIEQGFNLEMQEFQDLRWGIDDTNNFFTSATEIQRIIINRNKLKWNATAYFNYTEAFGSNINQHQNEYGLRTSLNYLILPKLTTKIALAAIFLDDDNLHYQSALNQHTDKKGFSLPVLPSISAEYIVDKSFKLRGKAGLVYNLPTLNERYWPGFGNVDIYPETGFSSEIGYDFSIAGDKFGFTQSTTAFYIHLNNKIIWLPSPLGVRPFNIDKNQSQGIEASAFLTYNITDNFKIDIKAQLNYTRSIILESNRNDTTVIGKQLILIPKVTGGASFSAVWKELSFYLSGRYNSGAYPTTDNDEYTKLAAFVVIDGSIMYNLQLKYFDLRPQFSIFNIGSAEYELFPYRPNPKINYQISLTSTFKL